MDAMTLTMSNGVSNEGTTGTRRKAAGEGLAIGDY